MRLKGPYSVLIKATTNSNSLRTTIPICIVNLFDLHEGDKLRWETKQKKNKIIITVTTFSTGRGKNDK